MRRENKEGIAFVRQFGRSPGLPRPRGINILAVSSTVDL